MPPSTALSPELRIPCRTPGAAMHLAAILAEDGEQVLGTHRRVVRVPRPESRVRVAWLLQRAVRVRCALPDHAAGALREYDRAAAVARAQGARR